MTMTLNGTRTPERCEMPAGNKMMNKFFEKFAGRMKKTFHSFQRRLNGLFNTGSLGNILDDFFY